MDELCCPDCKTVLRKRTYEEIIGELMGEGMTRLQAKVAFISRTGSVSKWWCQSCEVEHSALTLTREDVYPQGKK